MPQVANIADTNMVSGLVNHYGTRVLETLLADRTTGGTIMWATDEYEVLGHQPSDQMHPEDVMGPYSAVIRPRVAKAAERQAARTKGKAEVFTPSWLVNRMANDLDTAFFARRDAFNVESEDGIGWQPVDEVSLKGAAGTWRQYVGLPILEITCGEAPFVCSRYDTTTGEMLDIVERVGILDRKLRVATENAPDYDTWWKQAKRALRNVYGYEWQGDSLLIARINVFMDVAEWMRFRWSRWPDARDAAYMAHVISWNFWQMDGLTDRVPDVSGTRADEGLAICRVGQQLSLFPDDQPSLFDRPQPPLCKVCDWDHDKAKVTFVSIKHSEEGKPA